MSTRDGDQRSQRQISVLSNFTLYVYVCQCACVCTLLWCILVVCEFKLQFLSWAPWWTAEGLGTAWNLFPHTFCPSPTGQDRVWNTDGLRSQRLMCLWTSSVKARSITVFFILVPNHWTGEWALGPWVNGWIKVHKLSHIQNCGFGICVLVFEEGVILGCLKLYLGGKNCVHAWMHVCTRVCSFIIYGHLCSGCFSSMSRYSCEPACFSTKGLAFTLMWHHPAW